MKKLYRKIKFFFLYRKVLKQNQEYLKSEFNLQLDWINRAYTVINIPPGLIDEPYNIRKSDYDKLVDRFIGEYILEFGKWANTNGLRELVNVYENKRLSNTSILVVFGFSLFRLEKWSRNLIISIPILITIIILLIKFL